MNILQRTAGRLAQDTVCLGLKVWRAPVEVGQSLSCFLILMRETPYRERAHIAATCAFERVQKARSLQQGWHYGG
jgi:hypothetical protein